MAITIMHSSTTQTVTSKYMNPIQWLQLLQMVWGEDCFWMWEALGCWTEPHQPFRAKLSKWTTCKCSTNPHPHPTASLQSSAQTPSFLFQPARNTTAHDSHVDWPDAWLHISTCSNSWWFICHNSSYFPNLLFTPTLIQRGLSGPCFPLCCGWW